MFKIRKSPKNKDILLKIKEGVSDNKNAIRKAFYFVGKDLRKSARNSIIRGPQRTGRLYIIHKNNIRKRHRASAPGQPPANLTGNLQKSIIFQVRGYTQLSFGVSNQNSVSIGRNRKRLAEYGKILEEGGQRIKKRPFLRPAYEENKSDIIQHIEREIQRETRSKV